LFRLKLNKNGIEVNDVVLESGCEYTVGRGDDCNIRLEPEPGVSRNHFKIYENDGQWTAEVQSKFGFLTQGGQQLKVLTIEPGQSFRVAGYDFICEAIKTEQHSPMVEQAAEDQIAPPSLSGSSSSFEGNEDATRIGVATTGIPFLRIVKSDGESESHRLDGQKWLIGRDESCDIVLGDRKASRRQFELSASAQGHFIRDVGSANGTTINGKALGSDELRSLRSGDVITVASLIIYFEIRDPSYEKRLQVIAPEIMARMPVANMPSYEMINYPVEQGPGGAIRIDSSKSTLAIRNGAPGSTDLSEDELAKKKKIRFYLIAGVALAILVAALANMSPTSKTPAPTEASAFSRLKPDQQKTVQETYVLARNLLMQSKHALAATQLEKLHTLLPQGYERSLEMKEECKQRAENEERVRFIEQENLKQEQNRRIVEQNLRDCEATASRSMNIEEIRACLGPSIDLNPNHPKIQELIARVQSRISEQERRAAERKSYQDLLAKGHALYSKAAELDRKGNAFEAVEGYKKHIASSFPDPENLKAKSSARIQAMTNDIANKVHVALTSAEAAYAVQNYRDAISQIKKAKEYDVNNEEVAQLNAKVQRELIMKVKEIYSEATISEGIGLVEEAKEKWRKILTIDHPDGDYFKRAKNKLRSYGEL
jgi:pSer/pThr/pTyr-binding forkhead associated (FHA) protein